MGKPDHKLPREHRLRLTTRVQESARALATAVERGFNHWILTFSGGKDSTATLILALETALEKQLPIQRIDVVYSDTLIEIPVIQQHAIHFLEFLAGVERLRQLPMHLHIVRPALEERFWVCLLGKGYPPPHQRFRWCTRRLKIEPVEAQLRDIIRPNRTGIVTGVRFGESVERDRQLRASCRRGGECGQGAWLQYSTRLQAVYLAPIAYWQACDVWDFLNFWAPGRGYPVNLLEDIYNGRDTRFGCWMCTVVRQDKAMAKIVGRHEWAHLRPLMDFRDRILSITQSARSRYLRPDGKPGRLSLETRRQLLDELLRLQDTVGICLIEEDEVQYIRTLWANPQYGPYGR